jgi:glycosyltransferase involved in cell wall biosynthesis
MDQPLISVVLPLYNSAQTVRAAVRSIQAQTLTAWEMIVVDDASTDGSGELVAEFADPRIRLLRNANNLGLAPSLNRGMGVAAGKYFARMDADDLSFPERLARQHAYLEAHQEIDLVGAGMMVVAPDGQPLGVLRPPASHHAICAAGRGGLFPLYHPSWFARAEWHRAHPYNPAYRKAQDFELLLRAAKTSTYGNLPEVLLAYRVDAGQLGKRLRTRAYVLRALCKPLPGTGWLERVRGTCLTSLKGLGDVVLASPAGRRLRWPLPPPAPAEATVWAKLRVNFHN